MSGYYCLCLKINIGERKNEVLFNLYDCIKGKRKSEK